MIQFNKTLVISSSLTLALLVGGTSIVYAGYGDSGVAPVCGGEKPGKPWLYAVLPSKTNEATLYVDKSDRANSWTVAYGKKPGTYIWGLTSFGKGNERTITVGHLPAGTYYFVIRGNNGCMPGPFSNEMSVRIGGGARLTGSNTNYVAPSQLLKAPAPQVKNFPVVPTVTPKKTTTVPLTPSPTPIQGFLQGVSKFFGGLFGR